MGVVVGMRPVPQSLKHLNTWSPVGDDVWEFMPPLGCGALLEEACHWGQALRLYRMPHLKFILCFLCVDTDLIFQLMHLLPGAPHSSKISFLHKFLWVIMSYHGNRKLIPLWIIWELEMT